jgi:hypothetical protein
VPERSVFISADRKMRDLQVFTSVDLSVLFKGATMSTFIKSSLAASLCIFLTMGLSTAGPESQELRIDAASSKMVVHVGRSGLFGFAGHDHEVVAPVLDGSVMLDRTDVSRSKVSIQVDATAMKVTGKRRAG